LCDEYFSGPSCDIDTRPCSSDPCLNNATCYDYSNYNLNNSNYFKNNSLLYYCECASFYEGTNCESKKDICQNETCSNNGICKDEKNKPVCECFNLYQGEKCDSQSSELKTIKTVSSIASILAFISIFILYLVVILADITNIFIGKNKKKKKTDKYVRIEYTNHSVKSQRNNK
jgi:hypothetical protein